MGIGQGYIDKELKIVKLVIFDCYACIDYRFCFEGLHFASEDVYII